MDDHLHIVWETWECFEHTTCIVDECTISDGMQDMVQSSNSLIVGGKNSQFST